MADVAMGMTDRAKDLLGPRSIGRNFLFVGIIVVVLFAILWFMYSIGYIIWAFVALLLGSFALIAYFFYAQLTKYKMMDAMQQAFIQLYRSTFTFNFPFEVEMMTSKGPHSTIWGFLGWACGRTMLPPDKDLLTFMSPVVLDKKGKPIKNKSVEKTDDILWCIRVRPRSKELPKNILCIVSDSQISVLSRDATGDFQIGMPLLVYGHWLRYGRFFVCVNEDTKLDKAMAGVHTSAVMAVLEKYVNRLSQLAVMDAKTKPEIVEAKALKKKEAEAMEGQ